MKTADLIFIGIRGSVIALDRATGQPACTTRLKGYDFVNLVLEDDVLFAAAHGEIFCLEPYSGQVRWHNPLRGHGVGLAAIATANQGSGTTAAVLAEKRRGDRQSDSAAAAAT